MPMKFIDREKPPRKKPRKEKVSRMHSTTEMTDWLEQKVEVMIGKEKNQKAQNEFRRQLINIQTNMETEEQRVNCLRQMLWMFGDRDYSNTEGILDVDPGTGGSAA